MDVKHGDHCHWGWNVEVEVITQSDQHMFAQSTEVSCNRKA